jgi:hypothetical protein
MKYLPVCGIIVLLLVFAKGCGAGLPYLAANAGGAAVVGAGIYATSDDDDDDDYIYFPPGTGTGTATGTGTGTGTGTDPNPGGTIGALFDAINSERASAGAGLLSYDNDLAAVAQAYAELLIDDDREYYSAFIGGTTPEQRIANAGITFIIAGEAGAVEVSIENWADAIDELMYGYSGTLLYAPFNRMGVGYADFIMTG